jgi:hypothetical protein
VGIHIRTSYRWCWWLRNAALSYEMQRQLEGTVEADDLYHTAGNKGQATQGGKKALGRCARGRRKKREPGRGHYDKDRPAIIAWVSRQGAVVIHATRDFTVKTVQKAANLAVHAGSRLYTDSASSYRAVKGYVHEFVNHKHNACEQAELILRAALDPAIACRARKGEFVTCFDHFDLLQTAVSERPDGPLASAVMRRDGVRL